MRILHIVGARPNFMKAAPVMEALKRYVDVQQVLVHTGQHYDANMSAVFFRELGLPEPDINLGVGSGSHAIQTARIMVELEEVVLDKLPDWVLVYGDVNSTLAATLVCTKLQIPVAHVEAGLRSFDRTMPEEINRLVTDSLADLLFTPSSDADENLLHEGVEKAKIHLVGNVMIDTLIRLLPMVKKRTILEELDLTQRAYGLITLHRPSNVDDEAALFQIMETLCDMSRTLPLVFPVHPRTRQRLSNRAFESRTTQVMFTEPLGYLDFIALQREAKLIVTDSGGVQEESTYLGVPCLTLRENTERPVTIELGTNRLIGQDMALLRQEIDGILRGGGKKGQIPPCWDGKASVRIAEIFIQHACRAGRSH